jgi:hypothetical protein
MQSIDGRKLLLDAAIRQIVMDSHERQPSWCARRADGILDNKGNWVDS